MQGMLGDGLNWRVEAKGRQGAHGGCDQKEPEGGPGKSAQQVMVIDGKLAAKHESKNKKVNGKTDEDGAQQNRCPKYGFVKGILSILENLPNDGKKGQ
ncbi:MAG: hypothetical protein ACP5M4_07585 [Acidobacteriaceae bacterium]